MPSRKRSAASQAQVIHEPLPFVRQAGMPVAAVMFTSRGEPDSDELQDGVRLDLCCRGEGLADPNKPIPWDQCVLNEGHITVKLDVWEGYEDKEWTTEIPIIKKDWEPLKVGELALELAKFVEDFVQRCEEKQFVSTKKEWSVGRDAAFPMNKLVLDHISTEDWETWWLEVHVVLSPQKILQQDYLLVDVNEVQQG